MRRKLLWAFAAVAAMGNAGAVPEATVGGRPWGVAPDGTVWTVHATRFQFAPCLGFEKVEGAVSYRSEVVDDFHNFTNVVAGTPTADLAPVWDAFPVGYVSVTCRGYDAQGRAVGEAGRRTVWKKAAFDPARYEPRAMSYALAETRILEGYLKLPQTAHLQRTGEIDLESYPLNGYPSKMLSSEIVALCGFAGKGRWDASDNARLVDLARKAADFMIAYSVPAGQPLEYLPRTYHEKGSEYGRFKGEQDRIHLVYPSKGGLALVELYRTTKDAKYLEAAERIARTYLRLQEKDGTWPMLLNARTGARYNANRLVPLEAMLFLEALFDVTGKAEYRACSDRAFAFLENGPLKNWNWEGQFEDGSKLKITTHQNLSNFPANMTASYLVRRFPHDPVRLAQAEAICRFVEDQFVDWEPPYANGRSNVENGREDDGTWDWFCRPTSAWSTPCVMEQYKCYYPVDASAAKTINTLIDVGQATGKAVYLRKARAIADAQTRMIESDGFINTWSLKGVRRDDFRHHMWINCTMEMMSAFGRLAEVTCKRTE